MNIFISMLILILPGAFGGWCVYRLWKQGFVGRCCLLCLFWMGAVEAHSVIYPSKQLKEKYAQLIARSC